MVKFFSLFLIFFVLKLNTATLDFSYHNYAQITSLLKNYATSFPSQTYLYSIGKSVQGRELWVLAIANSKPDQHLVLRPESKYIGNMHGNEVPSKEVLLQLIDYLLTNQNSDYSVQYLLNNTRIHILPSMNPDGYEMSSVGDCDSIVGRQNANSFDLNRNFPDFFNCNMGQTQPETQAVIDWLGNNSFVLSANLHGGSVVANYPYDGFTDSMYTLETKDNPTLDNDVFKYLAMNYSFNNPIMTSSPCDGDQFTNGITNGAAWYPISGGMQDYNYWAFGCMEITLEIACCKFPPASQLSNIWLQNKKSLIEYLKNANTGIRGVVAYANGQPAEFLSVQFDSREPIFKTNKNGEYYRILFPGNYKLTIMLNCDKIYENNVVISSSERLLVFNVTLSSDIYDLSKKYTLDKHAVFCAKSVLQCVNYNPELSKNEGRNANSFNFVKPSNVFYTVYTLFILFCKIL